VSVTATHGPRAYLRLGAELLGLSWRRLPGLTVAAFGAGLASVAVLAVLGLALSAAINGVAAGDARRAVTGAVIAALAYGVTAVLGSLAYNIQILLVDQVGLFEVQTRVYRDIIGLDGLEHLERSDILDRLAITCRAPWRVMEGFWVAVDAGFGLVRLGVALLLLGRVSPWLIPLIPLAALPLWFDQLGQRMVTRVEAATAEGFRLQQHMFELLTSPASGKEIRVSGAGAELAGRQRRTWDAVMGERAAALRQAAAWRAAGWTVFTAGFVGGLAVVLTSGGTPGSVVLAITVATVMRRSLSATVARATEAAATRALVEPYLWLREYVREQAALPRGAGRPPPRLRSGIRLAGLGYRYPGTDRDAVDGITADLPAGSVVAIVGEYGSGKTTLVKLLSRFYRPDRGRILVAGTTRSSPRRSGWARSSRSTVPNPILPNSILPNPILPGPIGTGSPPRYARPAPKRSSRGCRTAWTPSSGGNWAGWNCPRASGRRRPSAGRRCVPSRCCSCSTSRPPRWTRRASGTSSSATWPRPGRSAGVPARSPSWCPTGSPRWPRLT